MRIGTPQEIHAAESRVAMTPDSALQLQKLGHDCYVEAGAGAKAGISDEAYRAAGVTVVDDANALFAVSDIVTKVRPPEPSEVAHLVPGQMLISFFYPGQNGELLERARAGVVAWR